MNSLFNAIFDTPKTSGYVLLDRHCEVREELSYEWLVRASRRRATELRVALPADSTGAVVVLVFSNPLQFVTALFACVYLGVAALPVAPRQLGRLASRLRSAGATLIVAEDSLLPGLRAGLRGAIEDVRVHGWGHTRVPAWVRGVHPSPQSEPATALIQLSSGTTGEPSMIELSPRNIHSNQKIITQHFGHGARSRTLGWLPHTHDMGLFGTLLQPFFVDCVGHLARPYDFVRDPLSWLRGISRYAVSTSGAPTFAFASCASAPGCIDELDLSTWDVAFVGAEPIHPAVLECFCDRFAAAGFQPTALMPCYGLAEATLFVTGERRGVGIQTTPGVGLVEGTTRAVPDVVCVGSIGKPGATCVRLRAVGALRGVQPGDRVGEILVAGPSVTGAERVSRVDDTWVATGDLGLVRDGRLYVCARLKEVIKVRGRSISLTEVDRCVAATLQDRTLQVCSFDVSDPHGSTTLWVAVQATRSPIAGENELALRIKSDVMVELGVSINVRLYPRRPRRIAWTTSGKLSRISTRSACLEVEVGPVA